MTAYKVEGGKGHVGGQKYGHEGNYLHCVPSDSLKVEILQFTKQLAIRNMEAQICHVFLYP